MRVLIAAVLVLLAGCASSRFIALPWADGKPACIDPPVGWWVSTDPDDVDDRVWVRIDADCTITLAGADTQPDGSVEIDAHHLAAAYGAVGDHQILAVPDRDVAAIDRELAESDTVRNGETGSGDAWHLLRVSRAGRGLRVDFVDHRALAHRIIDDEVAGTVNKTGSSLANVVTEDADRLRKLVASRSLFARRDPIRLDPLGASDVPAAVLDRVNADGAADR